MKFWPLNPYHKRSDWKTWLTESFSEAPTSKLQNNKKIPAVEACRNGAKLNYVHPPMVLSKIFDRSINSHVNFTGKNKVDCTMWAESCALISQKQQNSFQ